ncbi:phage virion morphogenesis protein [Sphingomonas bacterium]|uniref:phage virion morphogenesis protein n=1 Tax=Sphingomonas bacterium TaxID=1895847 RepID=UPI0015761049|nr:phage virion morphogenesis protein [Sphingomonas bacterium]
MMRVTFNADAVFAALDKPRAELSDLQPVYEDIGSYMVKATRERFPKGEAPDGTRWRQKSPVTLAQYLRRGDGNRPSPLIGPSGRLGREITATAASDGVEIGSSLIYSAVMQFGAQQGAFGRSKRRTPLPWGDIPARPFLGLSRDDERTIIEIVDDHLEEVIGDDRGAD